ncbi:MULTISPECIES: hypothetical protein [Flammeovirga]|uniref:Uncharacterized protein n=1 Tax=Flammeovirga agarivorans TaxID=2726742 RepID=A0A7X8SMX1_9BACT|nr:MULTISPECIES: hypothetical protein [Flammeovirga]NLR93113.1 hypothetical protein [Flammeovirga agarivorans]
MKKYSITHLLVFIPLFIFTSCFDQLADDAEVSSNVSENVVGQYLITGFQYDGVADVDSLTTTTYGDSYITLTRQADSLVSIRLVLETEVIDFAWNLQEQKVEDIGHQSSEYEFLVEPGKTSLNNLHLYITEDRKLRAVFDPALQPNIKSIHAEM